jgi:hypothetical protein
MSARQRSEQLAQERRRDGGPVGLDELIVDRLARGFGRKLRREVPPVD